MLTNEPMKMLLNFRTNCYIIVPIIWFIELDIKILMHNAFTLTQEGFFNGAIGHQKLSLFLLTCWLVSFVMNEGRSRQFVQCGWTRAGPKPCDSLDQMECFGVVPHQQKFSGLFLQSVQQHANSLLSSLSRTLACF